MFQYFFITLSISRRRRGPPTGPWRETAEGSWPSSTPTVRSQNYINNAYTIVVILLGNVGNVGNLGN